MSGLRRQTALSPNSWIILGRLLNLSKCQLPRVERVNTAGLTAVLAKASLQSWPLISGVFSPLTDSCFLSESLEFEYEPGKGCLCD